MSRARVVGAGVIGLTTALALGEDGWDVDVVTAEHPLATTSAVAGAFWYPYLAGPADKVERWGRASAERFAELATDPDAPVTARTVHEFVRGEVEPGWRATMPHLTRAEVELPEGVTAAWTYTSWVVDMAHHVPWLVARCAGADIAISFRRLATLAEAREPGIDLVVNCTGVEARHLAEDKRVEPVAGQVVLVDAPWVDDVWLDADHPGGATYVVPRADSVVCGGTAERGNGDRTADPDVGADILRRCDALVPGIAGARVIESRVGLRPARPEVRLHLHRTADGPVLHHYGHGGAGVTLSWGAAADAAALARELLKR